MTEEDTFERLRREPLTEVIRKVFRANPGDRDIFSKYNSENQWEISYRFIDVVNDAGWSYDEFNRELDKYLKSK